MFERFRIAKFRIEISAGRKGLQLPPYKGSTFRGGFGSVFRRIVCSTREKNCNDCIIRQQCPYAYIFETAPPPDTKALSKYESIPRPFLIEPPPETKTEYLPGEKLSFNLVLIGKAIDFFPYFVIVFREMGEMGLGKGRHPYNLDSVTAIGLEQKESVYTIETKTVRSIDLSYKASSLIEKNCSSAKTLKVEFVTPTRMKHDGKISSDPQFKIFFRHAMRRISALTYFHHGEPLEADYTGLTKKADEISIASKNTVWQDWERYSTRQKCRMNMGGIVGIVTYKGELNDFLPWLYIGEQVHIGKNTVFGLGKYRLTIIE